MYKLKKGSQKKYFFVINKKTGDIIGEEKRFSKSKKKELKRWLECYTGPAPITMLEERYNDKYYSSIEIKELSLVPFQEYNLEENKSHFKDKTLINILGRKKIREESIYEIGPAYDLGKKKDILAVCGATLLLSSGKAQDEKRRVNLFEGDKVRVYSQAVNHKDKNKLKARVQTIRKFVEVETTGKEEKA